MKKFSFLSLLALTSGMVFAQEPTHPQYVKQKGSTETFQSLYTNWQPGLPYSAQQADDEEFFISRVRPKTRFVNSQTQVDPSMEPSRKFLFWCPAGQNGSDGNQWNALPTYMFDSEVFNMWSYVDHFGNWTANFIRMPAAFSDVCHKNGVTTTATSTIAFGANITGTDNAGGKDLQALISGGADKMLQFLRYYGIDGIGLNSEFNFSTTTLANNFRNLLKEAAAKRVTANWPTYSTVWYNLMTSQGKLAMGTDASGGYMGTGTSGWFDSNGEVSNHFFLNYPWYQGAPSTATTYLTNSQNRATSLGRSTYDVYAGINMQGASQVWLQQLAEAKLSMGVWGAHNMNMLFESRNQKGAAPDIQQNTYMTSSEQFFTGGSQNPVNAPAISPKFGASSEFCGISKFITARSTLHGNLALEPFVTYFNLGNGKFFNFHGETTYSKEWYNIGIQDYLPTWRWWITKSFLGRDASDVPSNLKASFTWEDAWFGGSCMQITGSEAGEAFLHLFKTKYELQNGDKLKIRYKIVSGKGQLDWACSAEGSENKAISAPIFTNNQTDAKHNQWVEKEISVEDLTLGGKTLSILALKISGAEDFKLLVGEISLTRTLAPTPTTPIVNKGIALAYSHKGIDFKLVYKMEANSSNPAEPVYNSDVNAWYYKIYSQQEGESPTFCTATTSWAAYVVGAPININGSRKVRYGVSAVSLDGKNESPISWSSYMDFPAVTIDETIVIDKPVIKINEDFTVNYLDPFHSEATKWEIISQADGEIKSEKNGGKGITTNLADIGIYDVRVTYNGNVKTMKGLVQISGSEVGALPAIYSLKANNSETSIQVDKLGVVEYKYTGRDADGYVSRGLRLNEKPFRIPINILGLTDKATSYSLSFWFRSEPTSPGVNTQMLNIRDINGSWPSNNWGFVWNNIHNGKMSLSVRQQSTNGGTNMKIMDESFTFEPNVWTHLSYVFSWNENSLDVKLYVNGKLLGQMPATSDVYGLNPPKTSLMIGGTAAGRGGLNGVIDEVQFYKKALSQQEVVRSMKHFEQDELPSELVAYFDFETDANDEHKLISTGTNKSIWSETSGQSPKPGGNEGETVFTPEKSVFAPGAPFIAGTVYKIETRPTWLLEGATVLNSSGSATAGSTNVNYATFGRFNATLTLTNGWGSDSKTFEYVEVQTSVNVEQSEVDALSVYPNPFVDEVHVRFIEGGAYSINVFGVNGQIVTTQPTIVDGGEFVRVRVNAPQGIYFVRITKDNQIIKTIKVVKK